MTKIPFRTRLQLGTPLLGDGAMGTMLHHESHDDIHACFDALNVDDPELVVSVHKAYITAGSDLIETNTFSANRIKLAAAGRAQHVEIYNRRTVELARLAIKFKANPRNYWSPHR